MLVSVCDRMEVVDKKRTGDGFLATKGRISRTGNYTYLRSELQLDGDPNAPVQIYRSEDAVFSEASMASAAHRPLTLNHPPAFVDASNWKKYSVGHAGGKVCRDGEFLDVDMLVMDGTAISAVEHGAMLSPGYTASIKMGEGTAPNGEHYDGVMEGPYHFNHIAVLTGPGRGGPECRIGDAWPTEIADTKLPPKKERKNMPSLILDGLKVDLSDEEAVSAAFKKLTDAKASAENDRDAAKKALTDAATMHDNAMTDAQKDHDKALGEKDAKIADLEGKVMDQAAIDKLADAKADTVAAARKALGDKAPDFAGKSVADVRRVSVATKFGDAVVTDKSDDYVEARFDAMVAVGDAAPDAFRTVMADRKVVDFGDAKAKADAAFAASLAS